MASPLATPSIPAAPPTAPRPGLRSSARGVRPYTHGLAARGGVAAGGAMGSETLALRLSERIYEAALDPERWGIALGELSEAIGNAAIHLSLRIQGATTALSMSAPIEPGPVFRVHLTSVTTGSS